MDTLPSHSFRSKHQISQRRSIRNEDRKKNIELLNSIDLLVLFYYNDPNILRYYARCGTKSRPKSENLFEKIDRLTRRVPKDRDSGENKDNTRWERSWVPNC